MYKTSLILTRFSRGILESASSNALLVEASKSARTDGFSSLRRVGVSPEMTVVKELVSDKSPWSIVSAEAIIKL